MKPTNLALFILASSTTQVKATYTVAGADSKTGQLGAGGCTCVDPDAGIQLFKFYKPTAGKGLLLAQAFPPDETTPNYNAIFNTADQLLQQGEDPEVILTKITDPTLDSGPSPFFEDVPVNEIRQYGCVDLQNRAAGYSGEGIGDLYDRLGMNASTVQDYDNSHETGQAGDIAYSAQGNSVSINTVPLLVEGFNANGGCDLADRLFNSIVAVDDANNKARAANENEDINFEGDVRCEIPGVGFGYPGLQAYLHVDDKDGNQILHIESLPEPGTNPYDEIRTKYAEWRAANPCPTGAGSATGESQTVFEAGSSASFVRGGTVFLFVGLVITTSAWIF